jgi:4-amino-4-deoxy-L-arabinose transferase-like glycosyltransferase
MLMTVVTEEVLSKATLLYRSYDRERLFLCCVGQPLYFVETARTYTSDGTLTLFLILTFACLAGAVAARSQWNASG